MKTIPLTQGKVAIVDDADYERLSEFKWSLGCGGYAVRNSPGFHGNKKIYMHREIIQTPDDMDTDHRNRDRLDNRRENLRICNYSQNNSNVSMLSSNTSGYKGVSLKEGKWYAQIRINGKKKAIGYFDKIEDAAIAYNSAAINAHGEFAFLNEIKE